MPALYPDRAAEGTRSSAAGGGPVALDQSIRRGVVRQLRGVASELVGDPGGEHLAELDAPLVERIDAPDDALGEDAVLVECAQLAQHGRRQPIDEQRVGGPVPLEYAMRNEPLRRALLAHLLRGLAEREGLRLCEDVGHQEVVMLPDGV